MIDYLSAMGDGGLKQPRTVMLKMAGRDMVAMSGSGPGYMQTIIVTPYMHILIFHVPTMLRNLGTLKTFSGQGM